MQRIVIVGGGFAGVWSALSATDSSRAFGRAADLRITLVSRDPYLTIRPRLYESNLDELRVPLGDALGDTNVERIVGEVGTIDSAARTVTVRTPLGARSLPYDRLILAAGSHLHRPALPGLAEHAFTVDTFKDAHVLGEHLITLPDCAVSAGRFRAVVVGAGFTGLETVTELIGRLKSIAGRSRSLEKPEVVLVERSNLVAPDLGANPRPVIDAALAQLGIRVRLGTSVAAVRPDGVVLENGEWLPAATTIWTVGLRASGLAEQLPVSRDDLGRVAVDEFLRVRGTGGVYAAGDMARALADGTHVAPMSCQYAIPMGDVAGRNAVADLLGKPMIAFSQPDYVTCLDLGGAGALFTEGWDRQVRLTGYWAKAMKQTINTRLIYPPRSRDGSNGLLDAVVRAA